MKNVKINENKKEITMLINAMDTYTLYY